MICRYNFLKFKYKPQENRKLGIRLQINVYIYIFRMKNWKSNDVVTSQYEILTDPF